MKILFITPIIEHPPAGGPQLRIENSIKALSNVSELHIMVTASTENIGGEGAELFYKRYCYGMFFSPTKEGFSSNRYIRKVQKTIREILNAEISAILKYVDANSIDIVWFGFGNISFPLIKKVKKARPDLKIVCDTDSIWSRFILRELPFEDNPSKKKEIKKKGEEKEKEEAEWVNLCDVTTAVSEVDADYYRGLAKDPSRIMIFSNVIDIENYKILPELPEGFKKPCIYFAGSFWRDSPMEKGARWFIDKVFPLIKKQNPDLHFYIAGKGSDDILSDVNEDSITITGKLPSVLPYLCNADLSIVPLWFESGTRYKILEAGACNKAVVSTTLGAEGILVTHGKDILIADIESDFAAAILQLLSDKDLRLRIAKELQILISSHYSIQALEQEALQILQKLMS